MKETQSTRQFLKDPYFLLTSGLLFFTPLALSKATNELFEFPKMIFLYLFGGFLIVFFLTDRAFSKDKVKKWSLPVLFFVLANALSTTFSTHRYTSVFGYYSRFNDGLISILFFFVLYLIFKNILSKDIFEKLLKIILFTIIPVSILGLYQHFNGVERVYSTFGQPNWLAQYFCMLLPLCIFKCLKESFRIWFPIYLVGFSCFWFSYSVSGVLGFIISTTFLFIFMNREGIFEKRVVLKSLILFFFTLILISSNLGIFKEKVQDAIYDIGQRTSLLRKVYATEDGYKISDPGFIRLELWKSTLDLIFSSPKVFLIGTGPETFPYEFQSFRNLKLNYSSEWDFVFNKPHNYFLEVWSELGSLGLVSFLVLLIHIFRKIPYFLKSSIIGLLVTSFFGWPIISTSLLFWFLVSYAEVFDD